MLKLILSDQHFHDWELYSHTNSEGINSRLKMIIEETKRAYRIFDKKCKETSQKGIVVFGGDLFHTRGKIKPSVLNPTYEAIKELQEEYGYDLYILAGNHDLEDIISNKVGNSMQCFQDIKNTFIITSRTVVRSKYEETLIFYPWYNDLKLLLKHMAEDVDSDATAFIHAPINGVIKGIPDHGLETTQLANIGFKRVWAGHYHHHALYLDGKVGSIGALTHQTWGDIGAKSGFVIEHSDGTVEHIEDEAPKFTDILALEKTGFDCKNKYIRIQTTIGDDDKDLQKLKEELLKEGALQVVLLRVAKPTIKRDVELVEKTSGGSVNVEKTILSYVEEMHSKALEKTKLDYLKDLHLQIYTEAKKYEI